MTDLATKPTDAVPADETATTVIDPPMDGTSDVPGDGGPDAPGYAWAPVEPEPKKRRTGMWIGIGAGASAVALVTASLVLIAPGTSVAGVSVGWLTEGAAGDAIAARLASTTIVLTGDGGETEITGADLGASVDAGALAAEAYAQHPMWNPTAWFAPPADATVQIDQAEAAEALRAAVPDLYVDPVDATVSFDAASATYVTTPAEPGSGVDVAAVRDALQAAFDSGESRVELDTTLAAVDAGTPTFVAEAAATQLNGILDSAGFYVGAERTVPVDRAVVASWLTVTPGDRGTFDISADAAAIQPFVDGLAPVVNRAAENGKVITNSSGDVLREEAAGISGRELGDTSSVAGDYAEQLAAGNGVFELPVTEVAPVITTLVRRIEVNLSEQRTYLFENDAVVDAWYISSGTSGFSSSTGHFEITAKLTAQNMGNRDLTKAPYYFTPDVPWVMYYNGDEALHGAYWHNNFGNVMSHGCINMPVGAAEYTYAWAPMGTEVWVHY